MKKKTIIIWLGITLVAIIAVLEIFDLHPKSPVGTYISQKNVNYHLELRSDGTFSLNEVGGTFGGKYRIEGHTITITIKTQTGQDLARATIDGDTLTDKEGDKWVRK
jgi:hypothetical protein